MVFYECVVTTRNTADFKQLTNLVKSISHKVVENGGIVRSIQNHGIRELPHRFKAKYPDREGIRYYKKGRFLSIYYDASPATQSDVTGILKLDDQVLRNTHLKVRNKLWDVNVDNEKKNPFIKKILAMERKQHVQDNE